MNHNCEEKGIINAEVKKGGMPHIVLGDSRKGSELLHSTSLLITYVLGTQQGLQGICILVRETEKRSSKVKYALL